MENKIINYMCYTLILLIIVFLTLITYKAFFVQEEVDQKAEMISYNALFSLNGADYVEKKSLSCSVTKNGCMITLPKATRNDGKVLGYGLSPNDKEPKYKAGETISLSGNIILYVISSSNNYVYIDDSNIDYIDSDTLECTYYNTESSCVVTLPFFNKIGYEVRGYSTSKNSLSGFIYPNENYRITKDVMLYPVYGLSNHLKEINVSKVLNYADSIIEIEESCSENVYKSYLSYLEGINTYAPFLMLGSKISFIGDDTFNYIWGNGYVGMNYGPKNLRSLDVRCSQTVYNDYYGTMVHEMSHSWDFYYATKTGSNITSQSDVINLFNKYKNISNKPFRDYSYSSIYEFQADMMKYYYFKYLYPKIGYKELDFPEDIKLVLEKYICISKNGYDTSNCV